MFKKKTLIMLLVISLLVTSIGITALAASGPYGTWTLTVGSTMISGQVKKTDDVAAYAWPSTQTSGRMIWYRVRTADGQRASEAKSFTSKPSSVRMPYLSGYGYNGNYYKIAVQNDSSSSGSATVSGTWAP